MATAVTVLVVGAGPTGLLAAAELHRRGVECLLIDAHDRPLGWDRATVVHPRSLEIFEGLGIVEPLLAAGVKQRKARLHSAGEVLGEIDLQLCGSRYPFNIGISEEVTETILTDYLTRQGGTVTHGARLVALEGEEDGILATIEHNGEAMDVLAQWVVGADGYHSTVRTLIGIEQDGHDIAEPWAVFDASVSGWPDSFEANYAYLDEIPVILTALPDQRWRVYLRPSSPDSDLVTDAASTLQRYLPEATFEGVASPARFQCHTKVAQQFRSGRVLLAGDAAHTCSPAQGHGMNTGLQDAFNLAWKLALVCNGHASEKLLDSYHAERHPVAEGVKASGDDAESAQMIEGAAARRERDTAIRTAFLDPATRHHEAVAEAELDIDYSNSPIVMGDRGETFWPGQRLPDGIAVRLAAGETGLLHEQTGGNGHTVFLVGAPAAEEELAHSLRAFEPLAGGAIIDTVVAVTPHTGAGEAGPQSVTLLVVRADGHIGLRAEAGHAEALAAYLELIRSRPA